MKKRSEKLQLNEKMVFGTMGGVQTQRTQMRKPHTALALSAALALAGTTARANHIHIGGVAHNGPGERVEHVAPIELPAWQGVTGTRLEITGTFHQSTTGEVSVVTRLFNPDEPFILAWHGSAGFQLIPPGSLPRNTPAAAEQSNPHTVTWRLRVPATEGGAYQLRLDVQQPDGSWQNVSVMNHTPPSLREWYENGAVSTVGIAGPATLVNMNARFFRAGSILILK